MKTLRDLANQYEKWANENENTATLIMEGLRNAHDNQSRRKKLKYVDFLRAEAVHLRETAKRLRQPSRAAPRQP